MECEWQVSSSKQPRSELQKVIEEFEAVDIQLADELKIVCRSMTKQLFISSMRFLLETRQAALARQFAQDELHLCCLLSQRIFLVYP